MVFISIFNFTTMKTLIIILALLQIPIISVAYELTIVGVVTDIDQGDYVANQQLIIIIEDLSGSGFNYFNVVYSDDNGYYSDIISVPDSISGIIYVNTDSCGILIEESDSFSFSNSNFEFDFDICNNPSGNDCQAYFYYFPDNQPLSIQFFDASIGLPTSWTWDFGDGTTSFDQNPLHHYSQEGEYLTKLIIEGDSCYSDYEEFIWVSMDTITECQASYSYYNIPNTSIVEFYDESIGDVIQWTWDFGDGNTSFDQYPIHTYDDNGIYYASLFIETIDFCFSYYADTVYINIDSTQCNAAFTYELDTLNNTPHTFIFYDHSDGEIDTWYWDFGDGTFSQEQNPTHIYSISGSYDVCLVISGNAGGITCSSTVCIQVSTMEYYNFGGQAFIENYPINIDSTDNANIGIAYLYRKINNSWEYMDQKEFWKYGYYWFANKPVGEYLIKTELKENSLDYYDFAPSYHLNSSSWKGATIFTLSNDQQFAINVSFTELASKPVGIGSISGNVIGDISCGTFSNINIDHVLVHLFDRNNVLVDYTYTNEIGYYEFSGLGIENYAVAAEYSGRYSERTNLTLSNIEPSLSDIYLVVYCSHILDISETTTNTLIQTYPPQPNPASNKISCRINSKINTSARISIINFNGRVVFDNSISIIEGNQAITTDISQLNSGIYMMNISSLENNYQEIFKIVVIH